MHKYRHNKQISLGANENDYSESPAMHDAPERQMVRILPKRFQLFDSIPMSTRKLAGIHTMFCCHLHWRWRSISAVS